jgi:SAM-dependent methyltransferase
MQRLLEPEVMDTWEEAVEYDAMDFTQVNTAFAQEAIALVPKEKAVVLDAGTGPGRIPVLISQMRPQWQITAIDLAANMLQIASQHLQQANLQQQIRLELVDVKDLPYADQVFDLIISNSLVHHLPDPLPFFQELKRVSKLHSGIFIRDLLRPIDEVRMNALVVNCICEFDWSEGLSVKRFSLDNGTQLHWRLKKNHEVRFCQFQKVHTHLTFVLRLISSVHWCFCPPNFFKFIFADTKFLKIFFT